MSIHLLNETIDNIMAKDPAARSRLEVVLCYPGFHAVALHFLSHSLWQKEVTTLARFVSHISRVLTGIEIHPGAKLGRRVFIDHGMGVVIGETAVIGDDVVIYQGVTLGAGAAARMGAATRGQKRHPTLANGVIVGSNAEVQGDILVGENARVASGSIVLKDVPPDSVVVGVPGRVIYRNGQRVPDETIDIEAEAIKSLKQSINGLQSQVALLNKRLTKFTGQEISDEPISSNGTGENYSPNEPQNDPVEIFLHGAGI
ncbi:MAG TPA: serine O-acetyltransferase [Oculatellaceae cyanobacterium]